MKFGTAKDHGHTSCILIIILFDESSKYSNGAKFLGYIRSNTDPLCIQFNLRVHPSQRFITSELCIRDVWNVSDTSMAAEERFEIYTNLFTFRI
jgi:hypothetical protein